MKFVFINNHENKFLFEYDKRHVCKLIVIIEFIQNNQCIIIFIDSHKRIEEVAVFTLFEFKNDNFTLNIFFLI
jgi:hypothetical protein